MLQMTDRAAELLRSPANRLDRLRRCRGASTPE
jgi:hypothetical protein